MKTLSRANIVRTLRGVTFLAHQISERIIYRRGDAFTHLYVNPGVVVVSGRTAAYKRFVVNYAAAVHDVLFAKDCLHSAILTAIVILNGRHLSIKANAGR